MDNIFYDWFFESWINSNHTILGIPLKPFSFHHLIHLYAMNSPMFSKTKETTLHDLLTACLICSTEHGDNVNEYLKKYLNDPKNKKHQKNLFLAIKKNPHFLYESCQAFASYHKDFATLPLTIDALADDSKKPSESTFLTPAEKMNQNIRRQCASSGPPAIPWMLSDIALCMSQFNMTEKDTMNMAIGKIRALTHAYQYHETGETNVLSQADIIGIKICTGQIPPEEIANYLDKLE